MRILLIEDDKALSLAIEYRLRKEKLETVRRGDGLSGLEALEEAPFDLVLLDRMLPGLEGVELLRRMRAKGDATPVLMLTAMDGIGDRVAGLDAGADDYLVKPFAMDELMARIRALARRPPQWTPNAVVTAGDLSLDSERMLLQCAEAERELSRREGRLLAFLMRHPGQVLPRSVLMERVWTETIVEEGNLDLYIHFLRKKLAEAGSSARIRTIRGIGYQLTVSGGA